MFMIGALTASILSLVLLNDVRRHLHRVMRAQRRIEASWGGNW